MYNFVIRVSSAGEQAIRVALGLLSATTTHAIIGGSGSGSALPSASASVPLSVSCTVSGASSSTNLDKKKSDTLLKSAFVRYFG